MSDLASEIVDAIVRKMFRVVLTTQTDRDWLEAVIRSGLESHMKRVKLLEAVAEACKAAARSQFDLSVMSDRGQELLEAVTALKAYDEQATITNG